MKKIFMSSLMVSSMLLAGTVHINMDDRIKGQSYSGEKSDYEASKDGLGLIPLQHHSGTNVINSELKVQKKLVELIKKTNDVSKLLNIKESLNNGEIGNITDQEFVNKLDNVIASSGNSGELTEEDIINNAETSGKVGWGIGSYSFGTFWIGAGIGVGAAGSYHFDATNEHFYFIKTSLGNKIAYRTFRDNPWTGGSSQGPNEIYINGIDLYGDEKTQDIFERELASEFTQDYGWSSGSKSYRLNNATYYKIKDTGVDLKKLTSTSVGTEYIAGSLNTCKDILNNYPDSTDGSYELKNIGVTYCDMTTDDGGWTRIGTLDKQGKGKGTLVEYSQLLDTNDEPLSTGMYLGSLSDFTEIREQISCDSTGCANSYGKGLTTSGLNTIRAQWANYDRMTYAPLFTDRPDCMTRYNDITSLKVGCSKYTSGNTTTIIGWAADLSQDEHDYTKFWLGRGVYNGTLGSAVSAGSEPNGTQWGELWVR